MRRIEIKARFHLLLLDKMPGAGTAENTRVHARPLLAPESKIALSVLSLFQSNPAR